MEHTIDLGNNLKEGLFHSRKSGRQLAKTLGVHEGTMFKWLNNKCQPDAEFLWKMSELLDQDVRSFFDPEKYPFKRKSKPNFRPWPSDTFEDKTELACLIVG